MSVGLGRRYAAYVSLLTLGVAAAALLAAGILVFQGTDQLQHEVQQATSAVESRREEAELRRIAEYLSAHLFNPLQRLDVDRLNDEIRQVRMWLPVRSFLVTDTERRLLTDGTDSIERYGEAIEGPFPTAPPWTPLLQRVETGNEVRFAIQSADVVVGWAVVTLEEDPLSDTLRRVGEQTASLWSGYRFSLLSLGALALGLTLLLGVLTSAWLSRRVVEPLLAMSRAAKRFAAGDLDHEIAVDSPDELGELAQALNRMAGDVRAHEQERDRLIADLEAKNAELVRFNYTISHDLKTPLVTVLGFAGLAEADIEKGRLERARDGVRRISAAGLRMQHLVDDLLDLSRIGRIVNPPEDFAFGELVGEAVELVRGRLDEQGVRVEIADDLPRVCGDRARLLQVVQNLLENAAKFMGSQAEPLIHIGVRDESGVPVLFVKDNGKGFEPRDAERLFQLFEKLDPKMEGTGVGLALVRLIVEAHGGRVWAESDGVGQGATFCFTIPDVSGASSEQPASSR